MRNVCLLSAPGTGAEEASSWVLLVPKRVRTHDRSILLVYLDEPRL